MSSNIDDLTIHEVGFHSAQALNRMTGQNSSTSGPSPKPLSKRHLYHVLVQYNKVGSIWTCESGSLITDILKNNLDFQGWVVSGMSQYLVFWWGAWDF